MKTFDKIKYYISLIQQDKGNLDKEKKASSEISEEDKLYEKTKYFLEQCGPEPINTDRIWEITKTKTGIIESGKKTKKYNLLLLSSVAGAAIFLFIIAMNFFWINNDAKDEFSAILAIENQINIHEVDDVTLILPERKVTLADGEVITYNKEGNIKVDTVVVKKNPGQTSSTVNYDQIIVPKGKRVQLTLSDGTLMWLNSGSKAIYPHLFTQNTRMIYVEGEAFFKVVGDKNKPFIVKTSGFEVTVLGTEFNLQAYPHSETANLVLVQGEVMIMDQSKKETYVKPNELVRLKENIVYSQSIVDVAEYICWIDGIIKLKGEKLSTLINRLSLYYGKEIHLDPLLGQENIYGKLDLKDNLVNLLKNLPISIPFCVEEKNNELFLIADKTFFEKK